MISVVVSFEVPGRHHWPNPPAEFSAFEQPHSHQFRIICKVPITFPRQVELYKLRSDITNALEKRFRFRPGASLDFGGYSCEEIAATVQEILHSMGHRHASVFVGEEHLMGALVE